MELGDDYRRDHRDHYSLQDSHDWFLANNAPLWVRTQNADAGRQTPVNR
jgi:hypothetical protein